MDSICKVIFDSIVNGEHLVAEAKVQEALEQGSEPSTILKEAMISAMAEVGRLFEEGEYFVPEMLVSARAMKAGLAVLKPKLAQGNIQSAGRVVIGTVKGDLHDIGKNLVAMMFEGAGFEVIDLGSDVSPEAFVEAVQKYDADILAMSALLTTTMPNMSTTIKALDSAGLRDKVKVMIGGAPISSGVASDYGADGYAPDASRAVTMAKSFFG